MFIFGLFYKVMSDISTVSFGQTCKTISSDEYKIYKVHQLFFFLDSIIDIRWAQPPK